MEICGEGFDGILIDLYRALLASGTKNPGTRGDTIEALGVTLRLRKPRARISRSESRAKPFSAVAELLWYLAGSGDLDFIRPYIPDYAKEAVGGVIPGAYGPRIFSMRDGVDQIDNVARLLRWKPTSKRAVIQIFDARDVALDYPPTEGAPFVHPEVPCTVSLQFHLRGGVLHMTANMRSNDAYKGLPHDVFCFTMLQEMMARRLGAELGEYIHFVGSMHLYDEDIEDVRAYLAEGHQRVIEMPEMPPGDPFALAGALVEGEGRIRRGESIAAEDVVADPYWADLLRLVQAFWASGDGPALDALKAAVAPPYRIFVDGRRDRSRRVPSPRPMRFRGRDA